MSINGDNLPNGVSPKETEPERDAQPVDAENPPRLSFPVVGVGASAGGLEAFLEFFKSVPADSGMAFVLIQHLPPDRESMLVEILSKHTPLPVIEVTDGLTIKQDHVYVIRPGRVLTIKDGKLHLGQSLDIPGHNRPVDDFFRSLAEEQRHRAIGVIMSGMGSNGTAGAQVIKAVGGLLIAQDPETAKFASMPNSLMDSGLADMVLPPQEIFPAVARFVSHPYASGSRPAESVLQTERRHFNEILAILRTRTRKDFTGYKKPTVLRRVERRMGLNQAQTLADYANLVRQSPVEASALADDLLIHVTGFFRDPDAWEALRRQVIDPLVADREPHSTLRCWVAACSSGEEAYTLAILLKESAQAAGKPLDIKVFATDTADRTLMHARNGVYPMGIETEMPPDRLERFFDKEEPVYRVKKELRDLVIFAPQNLLQDPPFSRLDICSCRNLLIYLEPEMQSRALTLIHFGLREGGALFLGNSEAVPAMSDMYETVDRKWRIFRRVGPTRHGSVEFPLPHSLNLNIDRPEIRPSLQASVAQMTNAILLDQYTPAAVAIDRQHHIVYFHGDTGPYLDQPRGEPTRDLLAMARESVRGVIRTAIHQCVTENRPVTLRDGMIETLHGPRRVSVTVAPMGSRLPPGHFIITFHQLVEAPPPAPPESPGSAADQQQMRNDLKLAREELQSSVEELQAANEEFKASNEELTSVNEELQSTNEELETSKEEMQSLNEELSTVNSQLQAKADEFQSASNDLNSLLASSAIAVIFLDTSFQIRRFTPAVRDLMDLIPSDIGRPMKNLARKFNDPDLLVDAREVMDHLIPIEKDVKADDGRWFLRRALPFRTADNRIAGVVLTFVDITVPREAALRHADLLKSEHASRIQAESATRIKDEFLAILGHELRTPLAAVLMWVKMLRNKGIERHDLDEGLDSIARSAEAQNQLIEDLLDTSRIAAGKLRVEMRNTDLVEMLRDSVGAIAVTSKSRGVDIELKVANPIGTVLLDPSRLRQVIWNLLSNAIKFTPSGGRVDVEIRRENEDVVVSVVDTGRGISPEFLPFVFEPFRQAEPAQTRSIGGLGLGLAISKQLVELHGGTIAAHSAGIGKGATFTVRLPLPEQKSTLRTAKSHETPVLPAGFAAKFLKGVRILLAEDNAETRLAMVKLLTQSGAEVVTAENADAAIEAYQKDRPDIIISDIGLPGKDGCSLIQSIRAIDAAASREPVPAIALTAFAREEDRQRVLAAGFDHFVAKPVDPDVLLANLGRLAASRHRVGSAQKRSP